MSNEITGVIQDIRTRSVAGGKTAYNIVIAGQEYGAGLFAPKADVGDYVKFELDESRGYKNVAKGSLKVSKNKTPPAEQAAVQTAAKPSYNNTFDTRQDAISRQAASNTAIAFLALAQNVGALPAAGAKKGAALEALDAMLKKYTEHFYEQNTGVAWKDIGPKKQDDVQEDEELAVPEDASWE